MEWSITPLRDKAGQITHFVAVQRDVTARVEAERRVAQAQQAARESDRKKANLARYFSPAIVETLAQRDHPLGPVRRQPIAVLFVDIVGFVAISESLVPERVVGLLRSFYRRTAKVIFAQRGSIEKFSGDALMALFGVPNPTGLEATDALHAAVNIIDEMELWNAKRIKAGRSPIDVGVSANFGVVAGSLPRVPRRSPRAGRRLIDLVMTDFYHLLDNPASNQGQAKEPSTPGGLLDEDFSG